METLKKLTDMKFFCEIMSKNDNEFQMFLVDLGLLYDPNRSYRCIAEECDGKMNYRVHGGQKFRCTKKTCRKEIGYAKGTFFEQSHLSFKEVFRFVWYWCNDTCKFDYVQQHIERDDGSTISTATLVDWRQFCRDVAVDFFRRNPKVLGGPGKTVEIDESVITKRKYNRGRMGSEQQWFFGAVERESGEAVIVPVERRNAATLLPLIQKHILPGTVIMSDCWAAYGGIPDLPEGYQHFTVNHSENFVDPLTGANTQKVESKWQKFKHRHKSEYGTARTLLLEYVAQYLWKSEFKGPDQFYHFWCQVLEMYPLTEFVE